MRIIEPFGVGGGPDLLARALAPKLSELWGQPVTVENHPGAGATAGPALVAKSPPDGSTLLINTSAQAYSATLSKNLPYDPLKDFIPVASLTTQSYVLVAGHLAGITTVRELIAAAKMKPGGLKFGSAGAGTGTHLAIVKFNLEAGIRAVDASGSNTRFESFELFDDNTRFQLSWVVTSSGSLAAVTAFASHELAESITDPFNGGWEQTFPPSSAFAGQIGDVCSQTGISNGVGVNAYWSIADNACIKPTAGVRRVSLTKTDVAHEPRDGPARTGFVDVGPLCGSGTFGFFVRTFRNEIVVTAQIVGFESPIVSWLIDGNPVSILQGVINVAARWDPEPPPAAGAAAPQLPSTAQLTTIHGSPDGPIVQISVGPNAGNVSFRIDLSVVESFDTGEAGGRKTSQRTAVLEVDLHNEEIVWDARHGDVVKNCDRVKHLFDGPGGVIGPHDPGGPADLLGQVQRVIERGRSEYLLTVANTLTARPDLARALQALARLGQN
jgi:Tripartite tricarboxylate transporter family receptor